MRIIHATSTLRSPLGGAEKYALGVASAQRARGHEVKVVTTMADPVAQEFCGDNDVRLEVVDRWRPYPADEHGRSTSAKILFHTADLVDLRSVLPRDEVDVLHVHRFQGFGLGVFRSSGTTIHTAHDYGLVDTSATSMRGGILPTDLGSGQSMRARWIAKYLTHCDAVIFPSARTMARHQALGFSHDSPVVIPHGWEGSGATPRTRMAASSDDVCFGFIGKLEPHKGTRLLAEAWGTGISRSRLLVAGEGSDSERLRLPGVELHGYVRGTALGSFFDRVDVLVVPSTWPENFPLVVAEGLVAGCAFIVTQDASPPLVEAGVNGEIVPGSPEELRRVMEDFASNAQVLLPEYSAGSLRLSKELDLDHHLDRLERLYEERSTL